MSLKISLEALFLKNSLLSSRERKLIEMSSSRRDALDRVRHFEQLANGQAHSESIVDGEEGSRI